MSQVDFRLVNERACLSIESLLLGWFPNGIIRGSQFHLGSLNGENGDSLQVCVKGTKCGVWKDFSTDERGGDLISLYAAAFMQGKQLEAALAIADQLGMPFQSGSSKSSPRKSIVKSKTNLDANPSANSSVRLTYSRFSAQIPLNYVYFSRKRLSPPVNVQYATDSLGIFCAVPMYSFAHDNQLLMTSFEKIYNNGNKLRLKGASTTGCFNVVSGHLEQAKSFYFCEGFATALTVSLVVDDKSVVICCFGKQNLKNVLASFRQRFSKIFSLVCDNDRHEFEPDKVYLELASEFSCVLSLPIFPPDAVDHFKSLGIEKYSDWNDYYVGYGLETFRADFPLTFITDGLNSISDLLLQTFEPKPWIIEGLIPQNSLNLLSSKPKDGKTWWGLNIAISVTRGDFALGHKMAFPCKKSIVYYLALEDTDFRLYERFSKLQIGMECSIPNTLFYETMFSKDGKNFPRIGQGFEERIFKWVSYCRLTYGDQFPLVLIIDTFKMVRPLSLSNKNKSFYENDYDSTMPLRVLVNTLNISILIFHHNNKMRFEPGCDPLDAISGTTGLPGSVDNNLIFRRPRGDKYCEMYRIGRDFSDKSVVMEYSETYGLWTALDEDFEFYTLSGLSREILDAVRGGADNVKEIAEIVARDYFTVQRTIYRLVQRGQLVRKKIGRSLRLSLPSN